MIVELIAEGFPLAATIAILAVLALMIRAKVRRSAGATDAGPVEPERALVPGLSATAQDLRSIEQAIQTNPNDVLTSLQAMCRDHGIDHKLPHGVSGQSIAPLVDRLEHYLELAPTQPAPTPSAPRQ